MWFGGISKLNMGYILLCLLFRISNNKMIQNIVCNGCTDNELYPHGPLFLNKKILKINYFLLNLSK